ncbi:MAG: hypothetical protein U0800_25620 [Isosphaeraceae bacterium]
MGITYEEAEKLLGEWTGSPALIGHARAVEASMRKAAHAYGRGADDETTWAIVGLLHDADYDRWPDEHPARIVAWLRERDEQSMARAVEVHIHSPEFPAETPLEKALLACDELTGFVMACALVRPEGIATLEPKSVLKKLKDKGFAAKVDRDVVRSGAELLGVDLSKQIQLVIDALKPHAEALGIGGTAGR